MFLLVNLLIKLSMLQWRKGSRPLEIYSRPLGWLAAPIRNHWYIPGVAKLRLASRMLLFEPLHAAL